MADTALNTRWYKHSDIIVAAAIIAMLGVMIVPLPTPLLDLLLTFNITFSALVLLTTMYAAKPLDFSVFPSLLLVATLFRLSLNVASTRLILLHAYAGQVINAFGNFVVGGNYVVGFVIFVILVVIQFVVITRGATRIAEVAARFTLDAMPGKQMSIDADLNAGLIDEREARRRREQIQREADFYGAMDGASKFVRGDAIAGLIITAVNILGGFIIGVAQRGMTVSEALHRYTILTIGDGLVSQIPALIISTAAGIIVTRAASESNLGRDMTRQLMSQPRALQLASIMLFALGIVPGLPMVPFFLLGAVVAGIAYSVRKAVPSPKVQQQKKEAPKEEKVKQVQIEELLLVDPMELEVGYGLIPLVDPKQGGDLVERITHLRHRCAEELGFIVPPVRIRDNISLSPNEYRIKVRGVEVERGEVMVGYLLAMESGVVSDKVAGIQTREPAFGLPAVWISPSQRAQAESAGYTVVEPSAVIATHINEVIKRYADEIISRQDVQKLLDNLKKEYPAVVDEVVPNLLSLGEVQKVLQNLLREGISIRNLVTILETLADYAPVTRDTDLLTEYVRGRLARQIYEQFRAEDGALHVISISPQIENLFAEAREEGINAPLTPIDPEVAEKFFASLKRTVERALALGKQPVLLVSPSIRLGVKRFIERSIPNLPVLSYAELPPTAQVESLGMVTLDEGENIPGAEYARSAK